jgi:hypothetical protein
MDSTLQELSDLLCLKYPPSHQCMYGLARLNIKSQCTHRRFRRDLDDSEREKIFSLLKSWNTSVITNSNTIKV